MVIRLNKNKSLMLASALLGLLIIALLIVRLAQWDGQRVEKYKQGALSAGIERAVEDCKSSDVQQSMCNNLNGEVSETEVEGRPGWIVYASSSDSKTYRSSMSIVYVDGDFKVVDFIRDEP